MNPRNDVSIASVYEPHYGLQLLLLLCFLIPAIFFLLTEQNTLRRIKRENRLMHPGLVWLQIIPLFGQVWQFIVVSRIAGSIRNEMASWHNESIFGADEALVEGGYGRPTLGIGIAYCTINVLLIIFNLSNRAHYVALDTLVGSLALAQIICWIIYWVQLARYKNKLKRGRLAGEG
ncbi:MAG TPA: hypothetical protein VKQ52_02925 [Puia sp.]|nr:hypothetical protein [Puia sp.]